MANITGTSELIKNYKQAVIMSANKTFEALETEEGITVFFSIGDDGIFYITKQLIGGKQGWIKEDASSALKANLQGKSITAKTFEASQRYGTDTVDIALAVTDDGGNDYLFVLRNQRNTISAWNEVLNWQYFKFDSSDKPSRIVITDISVAQSHEAEYIVVDILKDPDDSNNFITRYFIDPTENVSGKCWNKRDLAGNVQADKISTKLGKKANQDIDGIYTLGSLQNKTELLYTPVYNIYNPKVDPNPSRFSISADTTALATVPVNEFTGLFVTAGSKLQYFSPQDQNDLNTPLTLLTNDLFKETKSLRAFSTGSYWIVWGLNEEGNIFYTKVNTADYQNPEAWSVPVPILNNVQQVACYSNSVTSSTVLFALIDGQDMIQLIQDPLTTQWQQRHILLPSTDVNDVLEMSTYTTHIQVTDDYNLPLRNQKLYVTSTSPVSVYINNEFKRLSPDFPSEVETTTSGALTILQQTHTIGAVCYFLSTDSTGDGRVNINPMTKLLDTVALVKTGQDLGNIKVTDAKGNQQPLVPFGVSDEEKDTAAFLLQRFVTASATVPANGTVKQPTGSPYTVAESFISRPDAFWGATFIPGGWKFFEGSKGMADFGINMNLEQNIVSVRSNSLTIENLLESTIEVTAGDIYNWLKTAYDDATHIFSILQKGVYHVYLTIKDNVYCFVLNCINDIVQGFEFILNKIRVFFDDLVKWLGFLFQWDDILRSHKVLKNIISLFLNNAAQSIGDIKNDVNKVFINLDAHIKQWADLETLPNSINSTGSSYTALPGQNSPQANYGATHLQQGLSESSTTMPEDIAWSDEVKKMIDGLLAKIEEQDEIFENAYETLKNDILEQLNQLSIGEIVKRLVGIIASVIVNSIEQIVDDTLDIIQELMQGVLSLLTAPLEIPVLSWLYKEITKGDTLTLLDAVCLVAAIPGTVIYKLIENETPFPESSPTTSKLIAAKTWSELQSILSSSGSMPVGRRADILTGDAASNVSRDLIIFMRIVAGTSGLVFAGFTTAKALNGKSRVICALQGILFFTTTAPSIASALIKAKGAQPWYTIMGEVVYGITTIQKITEIFSFSPMVEVFMPALKVVDFILGVAGVVPTFASLYESDKSDSAKITYLSNVCWNGNRMFTPLANIKGSLPQQVAFGVKLGCIIDYSWLQFVIVAV